MLTGKKLFEAGDVSEMLASVLIKDPDVSSIGQHVPDHMRSVVALSSLTLAGGYEPIHFSYRTGTVKVLDFGLAKALDTTPQGDPSLSPTLTAQVVRVSRADQS